MSLVDKLTDPISIRVALLCGTLTTEERLIHYALTKVNSLTGPFFYLSQNNSTIAKIQIIKILLNKRLPKYKGRFKDYFTRYYNRINDNHRMNMGYGR